ncbi:hypothetical protein CDL12_25053 [Handroanthus impetiginosus]|uniref:Uncharacterized protein n=1 Tax=Handroanthus impetiginosus TaxID=429701 RepID=A0A2G9GAW1_9LAMI|nr:hypothetical protein CDL12_25053 [Handroanthus impetiginosus]
MASQGNTHSQAQHRRRRRPARNHVENSEAASTPRPPIVDGHKAIQTTQHNLTIISRVGGLCWNYVAAIYAIQSTLIC